MSPVPEVVVDGRDAISLAQQLLARRLGYVPEWQGQPADSGADAALVRIVARYLETIIQRLNRAPEKNRLAFFAMLGLELVPPQAARAPVVFEPLLQQRNLTQDALNTMQESLKSLRAVLPGTVELPALQSALDIREYLPVTRAPAGTQVAAPPPAGTTEPVVFATEQAIGITTAQLQDVISLVPAEDKYIDHSEGFQSGKPVQIFSGPPQAWQDIGHELYLAHDTLLALAGEGTLTIAVTMENYTDNPLSIEWEYWDGNGRQKFDTIKTKMKRMVLAGAGNFSWRSLQKPGTSHRRKVFAPRSMVLKVFGFVDG